MAPDEPRRRHRVRRDLSTSQRYLSTKAQRNDSKDENDSSIPRPKDLDALRAARLQYLETPVKERRRMMKLLPSEYIGQTTTTSEVRTVRKKTKDNDTRESSSRKRSSSSALLHPQRRRDTTVGPGATRDADDEYVYGPPRGDGGSSGATRVRSEVARPIRVDTDRILSENSATTPAAPRKPRRRHTEPLRRRSSLSTDGRATGTDPQASNTAAARRPQPKRSATQQPQPNAPVDEKVTSSQQTRKGSLFSSLFRSAPPTAETKVTCLTCGSDVRISYTAKLMCSHRMCHSCLKRIFSMSVKDPGHMPPKCCTSEHIPLRHVDKLFDDAFKKNWNRKYQEYNTRNRIYCPSRGCGEWIKPNHITTDHGRKVGKCKRCGTRVCCICNNKMHTSRDCPKDPETKRFVEVAKEKGWQRCFSCSAMVELKEGCNHMTCRCTAEFCMVCGLKWKSCDCPWFNYEQVDAHLGNPARYQEELDRRRDQERWDENIARRMEVLGLDRPDMLGLANAGAGGEHNLNQNFIQQAREALTANYQQAEQAAWGLLNGLMTGRENRVPGAPPVPIHAPRTNRLGHRDDPAEHGADDVLPAAPARRPTRRGTSRRHSALPDVISGRS